MKMISPDYMKDEKVGKARGTLNANSGLGMRQNGLNVFTYCKMFWTIFLP